MARRVRAGGRRVPLLDQIEATDDLLQAHTTVVRALRKARRLGGEVLRALAKLPRKPPSDWPGIVSHTVASVGAVMLDRQPDLPREPVDEAAAMMAVTRWAVRHYHPGRYAGRTLYLRAAGQVGRRLIWPSLADDLELVVLPGDEHATFLRQENAGVVAETLDSRLPDGDAIGPS
jgi:hypothetical protein